ncbi:hypothetical protein DL98DRAFT_597599 [Cadophora sp. DSE1049]|nr:hypothetical protein DL98DRAFT_597599 [Cadophora sp. DSE1049]
MASVPSTTASVLNPTFYGKIVSTQDALIVVEACLQDVLMHIPRRPRACDQASLAKNGNVFVYEAHSSGIEVWQDNALWSPGEILDGFLVYRELDSAGGVKEGGIVKTTITVKARGVSHHLVSYYTEADVTGGVVITQSKGVRLEHITPRSSLMTILPTIASPGL